MGDPARMLNTSDRYIRDLITGLVGLGELEAKVVRGNRNRRYRVLLPGLAATLDEGNAR